METNISLPELEAILQAARKQRHDDRRFAAALKGHDLGDEKEGITGDDIKRRAEARMLGKTDEEYDLGEMGITIQSDGDDW